MNWKIYFKWIVAQAGFWLFWLTLLRFFFIAIALVSGFSLKLTEAFMSLIYGVYMDASMTAYILIIPYLLLFVSSYIPYQKVIRIYSLFIMLIISIIYAADVPLYNEWGYRMDYNAFVYLQNAKEASHFVSFKNTFLSGFLFTVYFFLAFILYKKWIPSQLLKIHYKILFAHVLVLGFLVLPIRGGIGIIPMNPGKVFFSTNPVANHAALNVPWNLLYSLDKAKKQKPFDHFMPGSDAQLLIDSLFANKMDGNMKILKTERPRIIIFLLESFTSDLIFNSYQDQEITPNLNKRFHTGVYFNKAYATGDRTEKGIASALSGFPSLAQTSILNYPEKTAKLPSLLMDLKNQNYRTSFYYGGDASFASMNTYFLNQGCEQIIDKDHFDPKNYNAKWGVHDHVIFEKLYKEVISDTSLFLKICLSLSSHPPYDVPEERHWPVTDESSLFVNTAYYTDKHLGKMLDKMELDPLWDELLIIIMADHGARWPGNNPYHLPEKFHIPFWMGGGAVQIDSTIEAVSSQNDLPATILGQMNLPHDAYSFSQDLFSFSRKEFAYYAFNNGFGWISPDGVWVYSNDQKDCMYTKRTPCDQNILAKAYFQELMDLFASF